MKPGGRAPLRMTQKKINIGVVGCGYWGPNLIRNFNNLSGCRLKTVCDLSEARLRHMKELYPAVQTTSRLEDLIEDPELDAIVVATSVRFHYPMARQVLMAGKHVFIEKPMASSAAQCEELNEIQAPGTDVTKVANVAAVDDLLDLPDGGRVEERVADHDHEPLPRSDLVELLTLRGGTGHRLFNEDMLPRH